GNAVEAKKRERGREARLHSERLREPALAPEPIVAALREDGDPEAPRRSEGRHELGKKRAAPFVREEAKLRRDDHDVEGPLGHGKEHGVLGAILERKRHSLSRGRERDDLLGSFALGLAPPKLAEKRSRLFAVEIRL